MKGPDVAASQYDVLIVGARCAGAATALLLARAGARVLVIDRQAYGSDTMSTHALMRPAVLQLRRWGLVPQLQAAATPPVKETVFHYGEEEVRVPIKLEHGVHCLYAPRRTVLDRLLVDAAREAGAEIHHGCSLVDLLQGFGGRATGAVIRDANGTPITVRASITIGADGCQSTVARAVKAAAYHLCSHSTCVVYGYFQGLTKEGFHWHFARNAAAGVIPTNGGHCVFTAVPTSALSTVFQGDVVRGFHGVLETCSPALRSEIGTAAPNGHLRAFKGTPGYLRQCHGPGWGLVGDAGYFRDPLTAHGITDALRDAELLAQAVLVGSAKAFESYQRQRDELSLPFLRATDALASFNWDFERVKQIHMTMSAVLKEEAKHLARLTQPSPLAA